MSGMTPQEKFKLGFLLRCAEEGCDREEIASRVKQAAAGGVLPDLAVSAVKKFFSPLAGVAGDAARLALWSPWYLQMGGMAGGALAGGLGGYGLAQMQNAETDTSEAKRQELMAAYRLQADLIRQRARQRQHHQQAPRGAQLF